MKIEKIQKLKNNKYKIKLDSGDIINTYDDVILNNSLLFNKEIDLGLLNKINNETLYYDCYNKTLKFIDKKLRSEKEIKEYLKKYSEMGYEDKILKKLKEINVINDENYAKAYISDRIFLSTDGPNKIKQELFNYGIDEKIIEENINKIDKETIYNKCKKIIDKKIKSNTKYSNYMLNQKIISDLVNKGYDMSLIKQILENEVFDNNLVIEKEFKKIYNKLSKKFDGNELYYNLKNKLYQKGFTKEEIEEYIKTVDF